MSITITDQDIDTKTIDIYRYKIVKMLEIIHIKILINGLLIRLLIMIIVMKHII